MKTIVGNNVIQVALIDDHAIVRQALKRAFLFYGNIQVSVEASSYADLLQKLTVTRTRIIIMDLNMPNVASVTNTIHQIKQLIPEVKILILTMHNDELVKRDLEKTGIHSFIHKSADMEVLIESIFSAAKNDTPVRPSSDNSLHKKTIFSDREKRILKLIAEGRTNMEISRIIFLSVRSIEQIRHNMKMRASVTNTASLIDFAIRNGMIE